ncbi:GNAT family N-acetyltransferase [Longispora albida]|uniref:GNAT family N-acetyltransferase n=1 Tax=Longispora albida TaxID=203523 RepID=UPI000360AF11|nr:GNAT family protein [Longispora albida]
MQRTLYGTRVVLRPATPDDIPVLAGIRATPEVYERWGGGEDMAEAVAEDLGDPDYRHANIDIYLDPAAHGRGLGTDAVRTLARHLITDHGHHRIVIDPAADNAAAIRCYGKVGFRPVGVMRSYERGPDGTWHDALLMDLLAGELTE